MLSNFTSSTFSFHTINYENGAGNTKVIVKFEEVSQTKKFVEEINRQDPSKEQVILRAKSVKVDDNSFSSSLTAIFSFCLLLLTYNLNFKKLFALLQIYNQLNQAKNLIVKKVPSFLLCVRA